MTESKTVEVIYSVLAGPIVIGQTGIGERQIGFGNQAALDRARQIEAALKSANLLRD